MVYTPAWTGSHVHPHRKQCVVHTKTKRRRPGGYVSQSHCQSMFSFTDTPHTHRLPTAAALYRYLRHRCTPFTLPAATQAAPATPSGRSRCPHNLNAQKPTHATSHSQTACTAPGQVSWPGPQRQAHTSSDASHSVPRKTTAHCTQIQRKWPLTAPSLHSHH